MGNLLAWPPAVPAGRRALGRTDRLQEAVAWHNGASATGKTLLVRALSVKTVSPRVKYIRERHESKQPSLP